MSQHVLQAVLDGDTCLVLETTPYSSNPRKFITIEDMQNYERLKKRVEEGMEA